MSDNNQQQVTITNDPQTTAWVDELLNQNARIIEQNNQILNHNIQMLNKLREPRITVDKNHLQ